MYDENDLYNEITGTLKSAGQNIKSTVSAGKALYDFIKKTEATDLLSHTDTEFVFTGQSTDLRYFSAHLHSKFRLWDLNLTVQFRI